VLPLPAARDLLKKCNKKCQAEKATHFATKAPVVTTIPHNQISRFTVVFKMSKTQKCPWIDHFRTGVSKYSLIQMADGLVSEYKSALALEASPIRFGPSCKIVNKEALFNFTIQFPTLTSEEVDEVILHSDNLVASLLTKYQITVKQVTPYLFPIAPAATTKPEVSPIPTTAAPVTTPVPSYGSH
jgi:hypothetical protein